MTYLFMMVLAFLAPIVFILGAVLLIRSIWRIAKAREVMKDD